MIVSTDTVWYIYKPLKSKERFGIVLIPLYIACSLKSKERGV